MEAATIAHDGAERLVVRVQDLQVRLEQAPDGDTRELAEELVSAVVQMYGAGLERILELVLGGSTDPARSAELASRLTEDPLVSMLMLIHDLHPDSLEARVQEALDKVRPYMESHGGDVELLSLVDGVARIHLRGSCSDCSASTVTLELAIKQALEEAAPDLEGLEVEGVAPQMTGLSLPMAQGNGGQTEPSGYELPMVIAGDGSEPVAPAWFDVPATAQPAPGTVVGTEIAGAQLVIANVQGSLLAFRDACAECGGALAGGELSDGALRCPACARAFFLPRAGRSLDGDGLQLEPVPLLNDHGTVTVALGR